MSDTVGRTLTGMKGVIEPGTGTSLAVHPWESLEFQQEGVYVHHHDGYDTITFYPMFTLRAVRLHDAAKEREGPNVSGSDMRRRHKATSNAIVDRQLGYGPPELDAGRSD